MGSFAVLPLGEVVELLSRRRATGVLTCERGSIRKTLQLLAGDAVAAASNDPRELLGRLLVNFGHLTEEQLAQACAAQTAGRLRLGAVLTQAGLVPPQVVRDVLAIKVRETLLDAYRWEAGLFTFDAGPPPPVDELDPSLPLADIAREAEFRATAWDAFRAFFPTGAATLSVVASRLPAGLLADSVDGRAIALARQGRSIDEIGAALRVTDFQLHQRLYALARQGVLRAAPPAGGVEEGAAGGPDPAPLDRRLEPRRADAADAALGRLPARDRYLLSRCDGGRTVADLVRGAPLPEREVMEGLRRLEGAGLIELAGPGRRRR